MTGESDIAAQFSAFVHAPIPYIVEAILIAGIVWTLSRTFTRDTMDALRERLNLATDRLHKATEEADEIGRKLAAAQELLRSRAPTGQIESATSAVQANVVALSRANNDTLGALAKPLRKGVSIPSGAKYITPGSLKGSASKPDMKK